MASEKGHHANRAYIGQDGNLYLNGAALYDANGNQLAGNSNGDLQVTGIVYGGVQTISVTGATTITKDTVLCTGTTTAPTLPAAATYPGAEIYIKNYGSGNCVVSGDQASNVVALNGTSASASVTLGTGVQGIFFSDGSLWHRIA